MNERSRNGDEWTSSAYSWQERNKFEKKSARQMLLLIWKGAINNKRGAVAPDAYTEYNTPVQLHLVIVGREKRQYCYAGL